MRRVEWMAVGWGGLFASIGLIAGAGRDGAVRLAVMVGFFLLGGFLAGVRAEDRRALHAGIAALAAYAFFAVIVGLLHVADILGGPNAPSLAPGGRSGWPLRSVAILAAAVVGGLIALYRLRPQQGEQRRRRPAT